MHPTGLRVTANKKPAQLTVGIEPLRRVYDLRHTFATFALRAGISTFDLSRYMGASLTMIDRHYGHLARDGREHAVSLLDALAIERAVDWVDAAWTPHQHVVAYRENEKIARSPRGAPRRFLTVVPSAP